ncbi:MAG: hypothetical protein LC687_04085 [Actinobacteria bacterium]|nr:hypothetical protein [Actinomycetota bacterium]MCA1807014.1 hypothetical protein [Actinomycetota bacterium]
MKTREVLVRFQNPSGKVVVTFEPGEAPNAGHGELKEMAIAKADPSGARRVVECRVVK